MDQARWLIVVSVVICMTASLALLQRFAGQPPAEAGQPEVSAPEIVVTSEVYKPEAIAEDADTRSIINYPKPPAHIFSVSDQAESRQEDESFRDQGRITE